MLTPNKLLIDSNKTNALFVELRSCYDFSRIESFSSSAKFEELGKAYSQVKTLKEAQAYVINFIKEHHLSSSDWIGGKVVNEKMEFVAQISYNGRVWVESF